MESAKTRGMVLTRAASRGERTSEVKRPSRTAFYNPRSKLQPENDPHSHHHTSFEFPRSCSLHQDIPPTANEIGPKLQLPTSISRLGKGRDRRDALHRPFCNFCETGER